MTGWQNGSTIGDISASIGHTVYCILCTQINYYLDLIVVLFLSLFVRYIRSATCTLSDVHALLCECIFRAAVTTNVC